MTKAEIYALLGIQALSFLVLLGRLYYDRKRFELDMNRRLWELGKKDIDALR